MPSNTNSDRKALRKAFRVQRRALRPSQQVNASKQLSRNLQRLACIKSSKHIAIYHASDGEISLENFIKRRNDIRFYSPKINKKKLSFHYQKNTKRGLIEHPWGFLEPCNRRSRPLKNLDIIILPLVAFTDTGHRMGMGGGFYDQTLSQKHSPLHRYSPKKPILIGVAHRCQKTNALFTQKWDIPCDYIVSDEGIYRAKFQQALAYQQL
ncbi:MAG: 5-formyltetrahydrofolate cyclo-ligase [Sinobacterium sp.]|nr:5-formyltetrahydrofolate cyclo-ligase [Sinobacterium sp.]